MRNGAISVVRILRPMHAIVKRMKRTTKTTTMTSNRLLSHPTKVSNLSYFKWSQIASRMQILGRFVGFAQMAERQMQQRFDHERRAASVAPHDQPEREHSYLLWDTYRFLRILSSTQLGGEGLVERKLAQYCRLFRDLLVVFLIGSDNITTESPGLVA